MESCLISENGSLLWWLTSMIQYNFQKQEKYSDYKVMSANCYQFRGNINLSLKV